MAQKKNTYVEPTEYIPKELRKKYGLGEFAKQNDAKKSANNKSGKKSAKK